MDPFETLKDEHRYILRILDVITKLEKAMEHGEPFPHQLIGEILDFATVFADRCHHCKEEGELFPVMESHGMSHDTGPIACMLHDHKMARDIIAQAKSAMAQAADGNERSQKEIRRLLQEYVHLLSSHIGKEDNVLFVVGDRMIPAEDKKRMADDFETSLEREVGCGVCEQYREKVALLEKKAANFSGPV